MSSEHSVESEMEVPEDERGGIALLKHMEKY